MITPQPSVSRLEWLIIVLVMALSAGVLSFRLGWQDYWWDEHVSLMFTQDSWYRLMIEHWGTDTHRPVYYGLQKAWNGIFGESTVAVRSLPITVTLFIIPFFFLAARRIAAGPFALITIILLATAPMFIAQGREVRMYCLANLALAAALWCAVLLASRARVRMEGEYATSATDRWLWVGFAAALALAFYAQAMGLFVAALFGLWIFVTVALGILPLRFLWQSLAAMALYFVLIMPALYPFFVHAAGTIGGSFWVPEPSVEYIYKQTTAAYPYPKWAKPIVALMILWGLWSLRGKPHVAWLLGLMVIGLPVLVLTVSFFKPIYMARVIAWGSIVSVFLLAAGLYRLRAPLRWGGVAFLVVSQLFAFQMFLPSAPERTPEREIAVALDDFDAQTDTLLLGYQMSEPALRWHAPHAFEGASYGFLYGDRNRNVIDSALRSTFVKRADAAKIDLQGERLFVVSEPVVPKARKVGSEDHVKPALDIVTKGLALTRSVTAGRLRLDVYELN